MVALEETIFLFFFELKTKTGYKWTELKAKLGLNLTTDAIRNRFYKVRNEVQSYYMLERDEVRTTTQMKENIVTDVIYEDDSVRNIIRWKRLKNYWQSGLRLRLYFAA